jgi:hypothetical protein
MSDQKQDTPPTPKAKKPKGKKVKAKSNKGTLTLKQTAFVDAYFGNSMNATMAYMELYPKSSYYAARTNSSRLITNDNIQAAITKRLKEKAMGVDELIARYGDMARASMMPFIRVTEDGFVYFNFNDPHAKEYMFLIKEIKNKRSRRLEDHEPWEDEWVEVKLHDAQHAMDQIGKMHSLFIDRTDFTSGGEKITVRLLKDDE